MKIIHKPLTCNKALEMMYDYMDGQLSAGDKLRFENHIAECASCKEELELRLEIRSLIRSSAQQPPKSLHSGVMAQIQNIPQYKKPSSPLLRFIPAGTVVAAAAVMLLVVARAMLPGGVSADMASVNETQISRRGDDAVYSTGDNQNEVAALADAVEVKYVTTGALTAASPSLSGNTAPTASSASSVEKLFAKLESDSKAVIVCYEADVKDVLSSVTSQTIVTDGMEYKLFDISGGNIKMFVDVLELLRRNNAEYRAALPDVTFDRCSVYALGEE